MESGFAALTGGGEVNRPSIRGVARDYAGLVRGYAGGVPDLYGSAAMYEPRYNDLLLGDVGRGVPAIANSLEAASPVAQRLVNEVGPGRDTSLLDMLRGNAKERLGAGAHLDPELQRLFAQSARGASAARGLGFGPNDVLDESMALTQAGENQRRYAEQFGGGVEQLGQAERGLTYQTSTAPTLSLLTGIPSAAGALATNAASRMLSPAESTNLLSLPYQGRLAASTASARNFTDLINASTSNSNWV